ncbi:MAG: hypothetical protein HN658_07105 [Rhodospirillales bacterium]|jgi:hypothetical protein|nr:hypothetical protein [Rhodospirillales bacterium]MBT4006899.1 hypothetical protein [Rhodospirillales bacterium]MBT5075436.1 hypothetical protein [Rhodospirillales bacterium]MBT5113074.1 hypothetical protein [Rhodospirillales bacterium]MBT5672950.1 hypothetical protein [Rhodospirillales bacterium]
MSIQALPRNTLVGGITLILAGAIFLGLHAQEVHQSLLAIPAFIGWAAAIYATRPLVKDENHTALYFAFSIMALMIVFLHETYEYSGKLRLFPLMIGYAGVVLSAFDILSLTDTRLGHAITRILGAALDPDEIHVRKVTRELIVFSAMAAVVLCIYLIGFLVTTPIFVFLWMRLGGKKSIKACFYGGFFSLVFVYLLFEVILRYELYLGKIPLWAIDKFLP